MKNKIMIDSRLKSKIDSLTDLSKDDNKCYLVRFKDIKDAFLFDSIEKVQEFMNKQVSERFYDKSLRKGYFDYINENGDTLRYYIESNRGKLTLIKEECI